jgi:hypothetical protein
MKPNKKQSKTRSKKVRFPTKIHNAYLYPEPIKIIAIEKGIDGIQLPIWLGSDTNTFKRRYNPRQEWNEN